MKCLLRYLKGSTDIGLVFEHCPNGVILEGFVNLDFVRDKVKRRSTLAYMFTVCKRYVSWKAKLQPVVALSSKEAKFIATIETTKEAIWLKGLLKELM